MDSKEVVPAPLKNDVGGQAYQRIPLPEKKKKKTDTSFNIFYIKCQVNEGLTTYIDHKIPHLTFYHTIPFFNVV